MFTFLLQPGERGYLKQTSQIYKIIDLPRKGVSLQVERKTASCNSGLQILPLFNLLQFHFIYSQKSLIWIWTALSLNSLVTPTCRKPVSPPLTSLGALPWLWLSQIQILYFEQVIPPLLSCWLLSILGAVLWVVLWSLWPLLFMVVH